MPRLGLKGLHLILSSLATPGVSIFLLHFQGTGNLWPTVAIQRESEVGVASHRGHTYPLSHRPCPEVYSKGLAGQ